MKSILNYEAFSKEIRDKVQELLSSEIRVELHKVTKNNGVVMEGLCILEESSRIAPTVYLDELYRDYRRGSRISELADKILSVYEDSRKEADFSLDHFPYFEKIKGHILCKMISQEKNRKLLEEIPYVPYLDLAVAFFCCVENPEFGMGSILIRKEHLKLWHISTEVLYEYARENTIRLRPFCLQTMEEVLGELLGVEEIPSDDEISMYVLSNQERMYGASAILYDRVLSNAADVMGESFYILPSSIHEVILVPESMNDNPKYLSEMVHEINQTQVELEDILSDSVYYYDSKNHRLIKK